MHFGKMGWNSLLGLQGDLPPAEFADSASLLLSHDWLIKARKVSHLTEQISLHLKVPVSHFKSNRSLDLLTSETLISKFQDTLITS